MIVILPIKFYRYFISPLMGPRCRFEPTCSSYAEASIIEHGLIKGGALSIKRLFKCHPWYKGSGYDPVPQNIEAKNLAPKNLAPKNIHQHTKGHL